MAERKQREITSSGYTKTSFFFNTVFNTVLSSILLACSFPFFIIISLVILTKEGGRPIFYKGIRIGLNKVPFTMYKFRTLSRDAENAIGAQLLTQKVASDKKLLTDFGKFLRATRLDELPQLFNILKADMDFLGPRPERPSVYEKLCKNIKGYDKRFQIKPGLIGYSQLFTPHSSPKKIRALIDNRFLMKKQNFIWDFFIIIYTIFIVMFRIVKNSAGYIWNNIIKNKILGYNEKRLLERIKQDKATVYLASRTNDEKNFFEKAKLIDINEEAIIAYTETDLPRNDLNLRMETEYKNMFGKRKRLKVAVCQGTVYRKIELNSRPFKYAYVIKYTPVSPLNYYMVHQYFLHESFIY
jgi:lipopolysaccharide/colanic/teichoic acid biosynthesis glycosyltransferase